MTWHSFFNTSTIEHRHLLAAYLVVLAIQGGYFCWIAWNWSRTKDSRR
jgi:hypothetical protein